MASAAASKPWRTIYRLRSLRVGAKPANGCGKSLDRIAAYRRGELDPEEAAKVEALKVAVERQREERRGEGHKL